MSFPEDESLVVVVLGGSGDLAKKKTFPALYALYVRQLLPPATAIYGYARSHLSQAEFHSSIVKAFKGGDDKTKAQFLDLCEYFAGAYDKPEDFARLDKEILEAERKFGKKKANRIFYFAIPPNVFIPSAASIKAAALSKTGWNRLIVEKPFGHDTESAVKLSKDLGALVSEEDLFRIDHYLGKEMVQNLMVLRFANAFLQPIWNRIHIASVQITFKEDIGTEGRGGYFDQSGIIRDVMQNHLIQMLALMAMEAPVSLAADDVIDEKVKLLRAIPPIDPSNVVIGQYSQSLDGSQKSYLEDDERIPKDSITPTFATAVIFIKNARWADVPFILRCGKALNERKAEIRIQFRKPVHNLFSEAELSPNELVIRVQPNEAVYLKILQKKPGLTAEMTETELDLTYKSRFGQDLNLPDAYERLLLDVIRGDHNLFVGAEELAASWRIFTPLLHYLEKNRVKPEPYPFGSRGPASSEELIKKFGYKRSLAYKWPGKL
eukprot:TRINITY_DN2523_c0_g1_i1.p1 TRINITY_DN2523_c0_g1~~TRINITY_DN2523_c0_g1_i1.p1  ORF type:complete len:535 (-),score=118.12 TRINITY_DN2523_c0_g1_i1:71-1546(-)